MTDITPIAQRQDFTDQIGLKLHEQYCTLTGLKVRWHMGRRMAWNHWWAVGFRPDDLIDVIRWITKQNRERFKNNPISMGFEALICNIDKFEERLADAQKHVRPAPAYDPGKAAVLRATGREDKPAQPEARSSATILARTKALEDWAAMKQANGFK